TGLLKWADVAWGADRFTATSPKTARKGKPKRVVPLFAELRAVLEEAWDQAEEGAEYVLPRPLRGRNVREGLEGACRRAGVPLWPRAFSNLRASRVTELAEEYPAHVVCSWCGHTEAISRAHYRMTTEGHFRRAAGKATPEEEKARQKGL